MSLLRYVAVAALSILPLCGQAETVKPQDIWIDAENVLHYKGKITAEKFQRLKAVYAGARIAPTLLQIDSGGGKGHIGLALGEWIQQHSLDVYVEKMCFSSCANFVFTAGRNKYLSGNAILGWHGGFNQANVKEKAIQALEEDFRRDHEEISQPDVDYEGGAHISGKDSKDTACPFDDDDIEVAKSQVVECLHQLSKAETLFYKQLGIDPNLPYYGQRGQYQSLYLSRQYSGFYYSLEDLEKMQVKNIFLKSGSWRPEDSKNYKKLKIYKVTL